MKKAVYLTAFFMKSLTQKNQQAVAELFFKKARETAKLARVVYESVVKHEMPNGDKHFRKEKQ
jgi:two-component system chemotaxis response regulator CheB